jgi:hypothetical protein
MHEHELPQEILLEILGARHSTSYSQTLAYSPSSPEQSKSDDLLHTQAELAKQLLVSHPWYHAGRTLLYSTPLLASWSQLARLHRTIMSDPPLAGSVKGLIIDDYIIEQEAITARAPGYLWSDSVEEMFEAAHEQSATLQSLIQKCQNVVKLQMWKRVVVPTHTAKLTLLDSFNLVYIDLARRQTLRTLSLHGRALIGLEDPTLQANTWGWAATLPVLEELSLREGNLQANIQLSSDNLPSLKKLRIMHCYRPGRLPLFAAAGTSLTHLELAYNVIDDEALALTVHAHCRSLEHLSLMGKAELRAFASLVALPSAQIEQQGEHPRPGPRLTVNLPGPIEFPCLYYLALVLIASPEARRYDFALQSWEIPHNLRHLVLGRRRWSNWRLSDFSDVDLIAVEQAIHKQLIQTANSPHAGLSSVTVEGTFPQPVAHAEMEVINRIRELCEVQGVKFHMTGRAIADMLSAHIADPAWEMNRVC